MIISGLAEVINAELTIGVLDKNFQQDGSRQFFSYMPLGGLAICRGFIEAMNGSIAAANRTDRPGAVFTMSLPVAALPGQPPELRE